MGALDEILGSLPIDQLAQQLGADPQEVTQAAATALPALLGGLHANASDPAGAGSILGALGQHDAGLLDGGVDISQVDASDGEKIASHIFGAKQDQVVDQLGSLGSGTSSALVKKLIPMLAPIVMAWLAKRVMGGAAGQAAPSGTGGSGGGGLQDILQNVLGGALSGGTSSSGSATGGIDAGGIVTDILGGLLGGGRR